MKTGLESLDTGAPEITYSGNQGPKSPQEDQQKMAEFQLQEYMEEFERVFPDMKDQRGTPDYMKELQDYFEGLASKQNEGIGDMAMKSGLIDEYRNYKMGQEDAGQPVMSPRDYYRSQEQDRMGVKEGGIMRTAFQGGGMDMGNQSNQAQSAAMGNSDRGNNQPTGPAEYGSSTAGTDRYPVNIDTSRYTDDRQDQNQRAVVAAAIAENKEIERQKELEKFIEEQEKFFAIKKGIEQTTAAKKAKLADVSNIKNLEEEDESEDARSEYVSTMYNNIPSLASGKRTTQQQSTIDQLGDFSKAMQKTVQPGINPTLKKVLNFGSGIPFLGSGVEALYNKFYDPFGYSKTKTTPTTTGGNGDNMNLYIPPMTMANVAGTGTDTTGKNTTDIDNEFVANFLQSNRNLSESDLARINRIGDIQGAADGGRIGYAGGGITDLRQGYFLGKLVKKATRGIKKLVKSPVGKLALAYAGGTYLGGLKGLSGAKTNMSFLDSLRTPSNLKNLVNIKNIIAGGGGGGGGDGEEKFTFTQKIFNKLLKDKDDSYKSLDPFKVGILGLSGLTYLKSKQDQKKEPTLDEYMGSASRGPSIDPMGIRQMIAANKGNINPQDFAFLNPSFYAADGGRIGLAAGGIGDLRGALSKEMFNLGEEDEDEIKKLALGGSAGLPPVTMQPSGQDAQSFGDDESTGIAQATPTTTLPNQMPIRRPMMDPRMMQMMMAQRGNPMMGGRMMAAMGGRMGFANGGADYSFGFKPGKEFQLNVNSMGKGTIKEIINSGELTTEDLKAAMDALRDRKAEGGMMDMGGLEKDYRNDGGFVPIGGQERADDVPARLSKNEFVFTADAVRNAGGGDIDKGAEIMENMMENLEAGGKVSQGSQGLDGAREMFQTQQRLGEVL